eukprot:gene19246-biopygen23473
METRCGWKDLSPQTPKAPFLGRDSQENVGIDVRNSVNVRVNACFDSPQQREFPTGVQRQTCSHGSPRHEPALPHAFAARPGLLPTVLALLPAMLLPLTLLHNMNSPVCTGARRKLSVDCWQTMGPPPPPPPSLRTICNGSSTGGAALVCCCVTTAAHRRHCHTGPPTAVLTMPMWWWGWGAPFAGPQQPTSAAHAKLCRSTCHTM